MNPADFLEVADEWAGGIREAEWRSAVSRAYYSVFHVARRLLQQSGFKVPDGEQAHAYLWLRLSNAGQPDVRQVGLNLNHLRGIRNRADYDLDRDFPQSFAFDQVQEALTMIDLLEAVVTTPAVLSNIMDAIKNYERDVLKQVTWQK
jgi:uncharacterized protein (UPF0332 family)